MQRGSPNHKRPYGHARKCREDILPSNGMLYRVALLVVMASASTSIAAEKGNVHQVMGVTVIAKKVKRPPGAPRYSDVCFSSRWRHPKDNKDTHDTFRDAAAFHATRLDWVYSYDPTWIRECRKRGYHFCGALNTILPDAPEQATWTKGRICNEKGELLTAPWMPGWEERWGCANSPEYRDIYLQYAKRLIDGGADVIQMDDPMLNTAAVKWGGCYCSYCRNKAAALNITFPQEMKAFQDASVKDFYSYVRKEIDRYAGRHVTFSSNNYDGNSGFPYGLFEYGTAELPETSAKANLVYAKFESTARQNRAQIFTYVGNDVAMTRRIIATAYACGGHLIVPYDVYFHDKLKRLFGKPEEYADLYGFVRANDGYLDHYEDAAIAGEGLIESRYGQAIPMTVDAKYVYAFARACPGDQKAPVVIHVVDWRPASRPFVLTLRTASFFEGAPVTAKLFVPPAYDKDVHTKAEISKEYSPLRKEQKLTVQAKGDSTSIIVQPLNPWGIIVLTSTQR